jgi:hypothetical protein
MTTDPIADLLPVSAMPTGTEDVDPHSQIKIAILAVLKAGSFTTSKRAEQWIQGDRNNASP